MNRRLLVLLTTVLMMLGATRPADASMQEFLDWLQEMSGPGGFYGTGLEWRFLCHGILVTNPASEPGFHPGPKCGDLLSKSARQKFFGVSSGYLYKRTSPYTPSPDKAALSPKVLAIPLTLSVDTSLPGVDEDTWASRVFAVGLAAGPVFFSGQRFETFKTYQLTPRITVKPGGVSRENRRLDAFEIIVLVQIVGAIKPEQFGGLPGPSSGTHVQPFVTASVDLERLFSH